MTKIDLGPLDPRSIPEARGVFVVRDTKYGAVAQKWPRKRGSKATAAQRIARNRFGIAARMAANPFPIDYATAVEMSKGTEQVPRDILTMAALGQYYEIEKPDGTLWGHVSGGVV